MQSKPGRLIIDTNLLISFLITKDYTRLDDILFTKKWMLVLSDELLDEFIEVARRPKFHRFFSSKDINSLLLIIHKYSEHIKVTTIVSECRDEKDNFLLSLAVDGKADVLITGDNDLLVLKKYKNTVITTIADFFKNG